MLELRTLNVEVRFSAQQMQITRVSKGTQQVSNTEKIVYLKRRSSSAVAQVVNIHAQHDVHAANVKQSKIIKNTVQRANPIIHQSDGMQSQVRSIQAVKEKKRGRAT